MAQKIENFQFLVGGKSEKGGQDYSAFLEMAEKGEKSKEDINNRINERIKFLDIEEANLSILKEDSVFNAKKIEKQQKLVNNINDEIIELSKTRSKIKKKTDLYFEGDKGSKEILERFKPEIEH